MGRTLRFTKKKILETAYKLFNEDGRQKLKVRQIAKKCGCSVYPIYCLFESQKELENKVIDIAFYRLRTYLGAFIPLYSTSASETNIQFGRAIQKVPGIIKEVSRGNEEIIDRLVQITQPHFSEIAPLQDPKKLRTHLLLIISTINWHQTSQTNLTSAIFNQVMDSFANYVENEI